MATYGLKYQCEFDPIGPVSVTPVYKIEILEKDFAGSVTDVIGSSVPCLHQWYEDNPKAPIKGSSLTINLINQNGSLPLESFFSVDDDQFKVKFYWDTALMFEGFLVQDDCSEVMVDFTHEINLSANDNLGLLKDVALNEAKPVFKLITQVNDVWSLTAPHTLTVPSGFGAFVQAGDVINIESMIFNVTYHVTDVSGSPNLIVSETVVTGSPGGSDDIELTRPILFAGKITLAQVLDSCLAATGLELNTYVFCNFLEINHNASISFIEQTLVDPGSFLKDDVIYDDCYSILNKLMTRFNCTLFQARGVWNIVHWDELLYEGYPIPGYYYDADFTLLGDVTLNHESVIFGGFNKFQIGVGEDTQAHTGLLHRINRPLLFAKETYNYQQPRQLLRNFDLQQVGALLNTYTTGSGSTLQTYNEYAAPWWVYDGGFSATFFIRVVTDSVDNEIERSMVVIGNSIHGYPIEVNTGDSFKYSFSFKSDPLIAGLATLTFQARLWNGTINNWVNNVFGAEDDYFWGTTTGLTYTIQSGDDTSDWHTVEINAPAAPFDGLLYLYLDEILPTSPGPGETIFKDIRFEASFLTNQSSKIIGHTHQTEQDAVIKQTEDEEIFLDDSPRNSIAGTLFLPSMVGLLQERTSRWNIDGRTNLRLGDHTTFETLFWRRVVRSILEGTFQGLISPDTLGDHVSMLSVFNYTFLPGLNFIAGTMEIDYRHNSFSGTLWEMCTDTEDNTDLISNYIFKYLYSTK